MILLNPLLVLLPLTLYIRISFGALYRRHSVFTRRWPSLDEINDALQHPGILPVIKEILSV